MAKVFKLDLAGLNELMKSAPMQTALEEAGRSVAGSAGSDYGMKTYVINYVAVTNIFPTSEKAARENFENKTLLKALGSAGLRM